MSVDDLGAESRLPESLSRTQMEGRPQTAHASDMRASTAGQDETVSYIPLGGRSAPGAAADRSAPCESYQFIDPPRAAGELGWLAHYRVRRCIGQGGMGLVFEAEDTDLQRTVALKVIRPELAGSLEAARRFTLEARAMAALKHDHIVTIYQVGQERGVPFLAMEYLQGMSLSRWMGRGRKPSLDLVLRLGREIAAGLDAAHKRGVIHRDIKPANIWLEAPDGRVKILDFGLARSNSDDAKITYPGSALGTPAYMAPEQARGKGVSASCDLFSLGCVLYELCSGRLPFSGTTILEVLTSLSVDTPAPPRELNRAVSPSLSALVMQLLAKEPKDRPASAAVVVKAIKSIERELLAQRQQAEFSPAAQPPADPGSGKPAPTEVAEKSSKPAEQAKARRRSRPVLIAAAVLATTALAAAGATVFSPGRQSTRGIVVTRSSLVPVHDERIGGSITSTNPEDARKARVKSSPDQLSLANDRGALPRQGSGPVEEIPQAAATVAPGQPAPFRPGEREPRTSFVTLADDPPAAVGTPEHVEREAQRSDAKISQAKRLQAERARETPDRAEWHQAIDPDGDCNVELDRRADQIRIVVPGTPHLLSAELGRVNAPRILRDVFGDFDATVRIASVFRPAGSRTVKEYAPYHGAGILLWQDGENYVRLEVAAELQHGRTRPYVNFELRKAGALAVSKGLKIGEGPSQLRLRRRGDEITAAFSSDGVIWTSFAPLSVKLNKRLSVGVSAVNTATRPLTAEFERFQVSDSNKGSLVNAPSDEVPGSGDDATGSGRSGSWGAGRRAR